jgi:hypothetical protein
MPDDFERMMSLEGVRKAMGRRRDRLSSGSRRNHSGNDSDFAG